MGVYIKGMEMPKDCDGCWHPNCSLWIGTDVGNRHNDCPLVPVPPHGRLIDADALVRDNGIKEIPEYYEVVCAAPTIIPAEEDE